MRRIENQREAAVAAQLQHALILADVAADTDIDHSARTIGNACFDAFGIEAQ